MLIRSRPLVCSIASCSCLGAQQPAGRAALEERAVHLHVLACVAEATAHLARQEADAAQRRLSEVKAWPALLPDGASLELLAPMPDAADPGRRLGARPGLRVLRSRREESPHHGGHPADMTAHLAAASP
jgi:hypothetical protein